MLLTAPSQERTICIYIIAYTDHILQPKNTGITNQWDSAVASILCQHWGGPKIIKYENLTRWLRASNIPPIMHNCRIHVNAILVMPKCNATVILR